LAAGIYSQLSDNFLLVADENEIVQVDSQTMNQYRLSIKVTSRPQVLAYDWLRRDVYWTSGSNTSVIFKYSFDDQHTTVVHYDRTRMITMTVAVSVLKAIVVAIVVAL